MTQAQTDEKYFDEVMQFANDIRMIGLPVRKEKSGYLLNSMLVPFFLVVLTCMLQAYLTLKALILHGQEEQAHLKVLSDI